MLYTIKTQYSINNYLATFFISFIILVRKHKLFSHAVKIQGTSHSFDIAESQYDNRIAPSPTDVKGERIKLKKYVCNKKVIHWFLITIQNIK